MLTWSTQISFGGLISAATIRVLAMELGSPRSLAVSLGAVLAIAGLGGVISGVLVVGAGGLLAGAGFFLWGLTVGDPHRRPEGTAPVHLRDHPVKYGLLHVATITPAVFLTTYGGPLQGRPLLALAGSMGVAVATFCFSLLVFR